MINQNNLNAPRLEKDPSDNSRSPVLVELMVASGGSVKRVAQVNLVSSPRRGESVEFDDGSGSQKVFRIMEVVHRESGLRLYGQVTSSLSL